MVKHNAFGILLLIAACIAGPLAPAFAQSGVLTGQIDRVRIINSNPRYVAIPAEQAQYAVPQYQTRTVYVDRPVVRPATRVRTVYLRDNRTFWQRHPKVKAVTIGAGVGAGVGAVTGLIARRGVVRGAAIGAGAGAGVGLIRSSRTMRRHPIIRDVATGTLVGLGVGAAASRRGKRIAQGAGVGAAVGLGWGLLRHLR